jgi:hypothetical protein
MHFTETWHGKPCGIKSSRNKKNTSSLVTIKKSSYSFRYNNTVNIPTVNTTRYGLHSLRYGAAKLWNEIPAEPCKKYMYSKAKTKILVIQTGKESF